MAQGDKDKYTAKQKRKAKHIAEGYRDRGDSAKKAAERAWRTVNAQDGGGKQTGGAGRRHSSRSAKHSSH